MAERELGLSGLGYEQELKRSLTTKDLIVYGLIFMVPIAPFGIYGSVASISSGMVALAYLIGMVGMIFTAFSYWRMSEVFPVAGSVYGYTTLAIGRGIGFLTGWAILLDYLLVPALLYLVAALSLNTVFPDVPLTLWILGFILLNTIINVLGIELANKFNWVMLILELIVLAIFCIAAITFLAGGGAEGFTFKPFYDASAFNMDLVMGAVSVAVLSFLGFDGISTLAEESKGGVESVGKACVGSLLLVGLLFILQTYLAACVVPWTGESTFANLDSAFYDVALVAGGAKVMQICAIATGVAWGIANCLVAQAAVSRILFSMARDGLMPKALGKVHTKFQTPYIATILIALISLVITLGFESTVLSLTEIINFGALTAFVMLHGTVIYYFMGKQKSTQYFKHLILPLIGFLIIGYVWVNLNPVALALGGGWVAIGAALYFVKTRVLKSDVNLEV